MERHQDHYIIAGVQMAGAYSVQVYNTRATHVGKSSSRSDDQTEKEKDRERAGHLHSYYSSLRGWGDGHLHSSYYSLREWQMAHNHLLLILL